MAERPEDYEMIYTSLRIICEGKTFYDLTQGEIERFRFHGLDRDIFCEADNLKHIACVCIADLFRDLRSDLDDKQNKEQGGAV